MFRRLTQSSTILLCKAQTSTNNNNNHDTPKKSASSSFNFRSYCSNAWKKMNTQVTLADIAQSGSHRYADTGKKVEIGDHQFDAKILLYPHQQRRAPRGPIEKWAMTLGCIILIVYLVVSLMERVAEEHRRSNDGKRLEDDDDDDD